MTAQPGAPLPRWTCMSDGWKSEQNLAQAMDHENHDVYTVVESQNLPEVHPSKGLHSSI